MHTLLLNYLTDSYHHFLYCIKLLDGDTLNIRYPVFERQRNRFYNQQLEANMRFFTKWRGGGCVQSEKSFCSKLVTHITHPRAYNVNNYTPQLLYSLVHILYYIRLMLQFTYIEVCFSSPI